MASDPQNNRMDEALKGFAKKRREEAVAPFELHPATRQLLQGEVARVHRPSAASRRSLLQTITLFWPRLAFAAAAFAVLGLVCWLVFPPLHSASTDLAKNIDTFRMSAPDDKTGRGREGKSLR